MVVEAEVEVAEAETTEVEEAVVEAVASAVEVLRSGSNTFLHRSSGMLESHRISTPRRLWQEMTTGGVTIMIGAATRQGNARSLRLGCTIQRIPTAR